MDDIEEKPMFAKISEKISNTNNRGCLEEHYISGELVYQGSFLSIQRDKVCLPNRTVTSREYFIHPGAVAIIPLFSDKQVLIERQFRYPLKQVHIEYPAGKLDISDQVSRKIDEDNLFVNIDGQRLKECALSNGSLSTNISSLICAQRELKEETGFIAERWKFITRIHPAIAYSNEFVDIFLAEDLSQGEYSPDSDEFILLEKVSIKQMLNWIQDGTISDPKTIIATLWLDKWLLNFPS